MADAVVCDAIKVRLMDGPVTVRSDGEFRRQVSVPCTARVFKSALSDLIIRGEVLRQRPQAEGCTAEEPEITFSLVDMHH